MKGICIVYYYYSAGILDYMTTRPSGWIVEHCLDSSRAAVRENILFSNLRIHHHLP